MRIERAAAAPPRCLAARCDPHVDGREHAPERSELERPRACRAPRGDTVCRLTPATAREVLLPPAAAHADRPQHASDGEIVHDWIVARRPSSGGSRPLTGGSLREDRMRQAETRDRRDPGGTGRGSLRWEPGAIARGRGAARRAAGRLGRRWPVPAGLRAPETDVHGGRGRSRGSRRCPSSGRASGRSARAAGDRSSFGIGEVTRPTRDGARVSRQTASLFPIGDGSPITQRDHASQAASAAMIQMRGSTWTSSRTRNSTSRWARGISPRSRRSRRATAARTRTTLSAPIRIEVVPEPLTGAV